MTDLTAQERERLMCSPRRAAQVQLPPDAEWFDFWDDGWKAGYEAAEQRVAELERENADWKSVWSETEARGRKLESRLQRATEALREIERSPFDHTEKARQALAALAGEDDG